MQNLSDESNFDNKEEYYNTDSTHSSEVPKGESDHTPDTDDD